MPFYDDEHGGMGHGSFTFRGRIVSYESVESFTADERIVVIAMVPDDDRNTAYVYYRKLAQNGNTINEIRNGKLHFKLGTLVDGKISSISPGHLPTDIAPETERKILTAMNTPAGVELQLIANTTPGSGAPGNLTYACRIR
ncbi:MAG: hypothetical protein Greene041619_931 [Candidatus Peregrinibacteria bacterium Greene0416_19]|nr:MAG: hypothetical protein Greene041619_931 [Candidatus Peregrinibacteria bacterium Greene0416_19]